jgi:hypothetical protein
VVDNQELLCYKVCTQQQKRKNTKMKNIVSIIALVAATASSAVAEDAKTTYVGFGDGAWSFGSIGTNGFGLDVASEGTMTDYTTGQYGSESSSFSLNLVVGDTDVSDNGLSIFYGGLLGLKQTSRYCPSGTSTIGFTCYADTDSAGEWGLNYGAVAGIGYKGMTVGARVTGESTQTIIGYSVKF